jgi:hypothetical protein
LTIAACVREQEAADLIRLQADALLRLERRREAACLVAARGTGDLMLWCGPLATWDTKSSGLSLSAFLFERSPQLGSYIIGIDDRLRDGVAALGTLVGQQLSLGDVAPFVPGSLLVCGGEANTAPKHFSYFLPEDFGVTRARTAKATIVFTNVYLARHEYIAVPAAREVFTELDPYVDDDETLRLLLLWFRAHDMAHSFRSDRTDFRKLKAAIGRSRSVVLQEALVDVIGILMALDIAQSDSSYRAGRVAGVFLVELLAYLRRGVEWFPDSGAAAIEFAFLVQQGALVVDPQRRLSWNLVDVRAALVMLAGVLTRSVIETDVPVAADLIERYLVDPSKDVQLFIARLGSRLSDVPTSFSYKLADSSYRTSG